MTPILHANHGAHCVPPRWQERESSASRTFSSAWTSASAAWSNCYLAIVSPRSTFSLSTPGRRHLSAKVQAMFNVLVEHFHGLPDWTGAS
jgi:hypothetical protein